jgi:hypothetical protein
MTRNDVGVDAVLSADVGDAPMRQRQYTAPSAGVTQLPDTIRKHRLPAGDHRRV